MNRMVVFELNRKCEMESYLNDIFEEYRMKPISVSIAYDQRIEKYIVCVVVECQQEDYESWRM